MTVETPIHLVDPEPRQRFYPIISVDDHLVEPSHIFEGRMPAQLADKAPRVVEVPRDGRPPAQSWLYEEKILHQGGSNAVAGHPRDGVQEYLFGPARYDDMRPGCYDIDARIKDMDIAGIAAMLNFPSFLTGFCGARFMQSKDKELGLACVRAWNDWLYEEWYSPHPTRIIPMGLTWLSDPDVAVKEIHRNAERGFKAVSLPERPHNIGLPSLYSGYWDPIIAACQDTESAICVHVGSSGGFVFPPEAPQLAVISSLFSTQSLMACVDWLWSGLPLRFPNIKIVLSEGGIGWLPMLYDRLEYIHSRSSNFGEGNPRATEMLARNFYFCTLDDPSTLTTAIGLVGADHIMVETDYPHLDSTWPDSQQLLHDRFSQIPGLSEEMIAEVTHRAASRVFGVSVPAGF